MTKMSCLYIFIYIQNGPTSFLVITVSIGWLIRITWRWIGLCVSCQCTLIWGNGSAGLVLLQCLLVDGCSTVARTVCGQSRGWSTISLVDNWIDAFRFECVRIGDDIAANSWCLAIVLAEARVTRRWVHAIAGARWATGSVWVRANNIATVRKREKMEDNVWNSWFEW